MPVDRENKLLGVGNKTATVYAFTNFYLVLFADVQSCVGRARVPSTSALTVAAYIIAGSSCSVCRTKYREHWPELNK
jgi:hypothetical protein